MRAAAASNQIQVYVCTGVHVIVRESVLDLPPKWKDVGSQCWICHRSARTLVVRDTDSRLAYLGG